MTLARTLSVCLFVALLTACPEDNAGPSIPDSVISADTRTDGGSDATPPQDVPVSSQVPDSGEVIFTELMKDTSNVPDDDGEWFELKNVSSEVVDLQGCVISSDSDDPHTIATALPIQPGALIVIGRLADTSVNGGVNLQYAQEDIKLSNAGDVITLTCDGTAIDSVTYDDVAWPATSGRALSLSPEAETATDNDDPANWCDAVDTFGGADVDYGTPGSPNPSCNIPTPCEPNPCDTAPAAECDGNELLVYGLPGTCSNDNGSASCSYVVTMTDCVAEFGTSCVAGACEGAPSAPSAAGDLLITEIMKDTTAVGDDEGEWFEVYNVTGETLLLTGCSLISEGDQAFTIDAGVSIGAGEYLVFGRLADTALNGGVAVDVAYGDTVKLSNGGDTLEVSCGGTSIDLVAYDDTLGWPDVSGASASLDPASLDATANDSPAVWCSASDTYGDGDLGSPGAANPTCPDLCAGIICDTQPAAACNGNSVETFDAVGTCNPTSGACTYAVASTTDCGADTCVVGACEAGGAPQPGPGELVITEIFYNATGADDDKEWFEVYNPTSTTFDLNGCSFEDAGANLATIDQPVPVAAGGYIVLAQSSNSGLNGGLTNVAFAYGASPGLGQSPGDSLTVTCSGGVVDTVDYTGFSAVPEGTALSLDPGSLDPAANDADGNWCAAVDGFGDGGLGTPGAANPACTIDLCAGVTCDNQPPTSCNGNAAETFEASGTCDPQDGTCDYAVASSNDCGPDTCVDGACVAGVDPNPGANQLIITEIFYNAVGADNDKEWFELHNPTNTQFDLNGCTWTDAGGNVENIDQSVVVAPGAYIVLAQSDDTSLNGGIPSVTYAYGTNPSLGQSPGDAITLACGGATVDSVDYAPFAFGAEGASIQLDPGALDPTSNDTAGNWCLGTDTYGTDGSLGTPGAGNPACPANPCDGVTCDTPPAGDCDGNSVQTYEATGTCSPADGSCAYAVASSTDCGTDTCTDGACLPPAGDPQPGPGDLVITEFMNDPSGTDANKEWFELHNPTTAQFDLNGCTWEDDGGNVENIDQSVVIAPGAYIVLAQSADSGLNGGLPAVAYSYGGNPGLGAGDAITLTCTGGIVDTVDFAAFSSIVEGAALSLDPSGLASGANDTEGNWCPAVGSYGDGDLGTPGSPNPACAGVVTCDDPPADDCDNGAVQVYEAAGTWDGSVCSYTVAATTSCTGGDVCQAGACIDPSDTAFDLMQVALAGDLVITEVMKNPAGPSDSDAEWFEVLNLAGGDVELSGCTIATDGGSHTIAPNGSMVIADGAYAVFSVNRDQYSNSGIAGVAYEFSGIQLTNGDDALTLDCNGAVLDAVVYTDADFPDTSGVSMQFDKDLLFGATFNDAETLAQLNDDGAGWCEGTATFGPDGNTGTPGTANDCP